MCENLGKIKIKYFSTYFVGSHVSINFNQFSFNCSENLFFPISLILGISGLFSVGLSLSRDAFRGPVRLAQGHRLDPRWLCVSICIRVASTNSLIGHEPNVTHRLQKTPAVYVPFGLFVSRASVRRDLHRRIDDKLSARVFLREICRIIFVSSLFFYFI